ASRTPPDSWSLRGSLTGSCHGTFSPLSMEAFSSETLCRPEACMVQPGLRRLPLTASDKDACLEAFKCCSMMALSTGLSSGFLLKFSVSPLFSHRRCKLQVLDLQDSVENFWMVLMVLPQCQGGQKPVQDCKDERTAPLTNRTLDEYLTYPLLWVKQRRDLLHLCCKKLKILGMPFRNIRSILKMVNLDCIQEVEVNCRWKLQFLTQFTPNLGHMRNLQKLVLSHMDVSRYVSPEQKKEIVTQFTTQFLKLCCLQKLYMNSVSFLEGHLDQLLSCLKTSLKILAITNCALLESDLKHLSQCPSISQLKTLDLNGIRLTNYSLVPLQILLEKVAATLEYLDLDDCGIVDSQVNTILPALSHCFELNTFSFCGNPICMATLENLLSHTIILKNLCLELYPAPRESYDADGTLCWSRFAQLRADLMKRVRDLRHPKRILFCTDYCPDCGNRSFYDLEADQCCC
uniref:Uncharacterized protein n=1 Tax=Pan troglodytes TaxID=9598 RepID=A0A2I3RDB7_PANTR